MNDKLQSVLGEDGMVELRALIASAQPAPAVVQQPWQVFALGLVKSWTAWFAAALVALPDLLPMLLPQLQEMLDANAYKHIAQISGVIMLLLRVKTKESIVDKGTKPAPPTSP